MVSRGSLGELADEGEVDAALEGTTNGRSRWVRGMKKALM
jgi:hypothetical protein